MSQLKIEVVGADAMTLADEVAQQLRVMLGVESTPRRCSDDGTRYELPLSVELVGSWVLGERDERVKQWAAVQQWATDRLGEEQQRVQVSGGWLVNHPLAGLNGEDLLDAAVDLRDGMRVVRLMMRDGLLRAELDEQLVHERRLTEQDGAMLEALATEYAGQVELGRTREMLGLGRRLGAWLDGESGWWSSVAAAARGTVGLEVCVADPGESLAGAVLHAPWELIAGQTEGFWAIHPRVRLAVWRRLGRPVQPALRPPTSSLSVLFMAASPAGVSELDYEQEETAVLRATEGLPLDLFVEETGTVEELGEELSRLSEEAPVQVMHLSCHGSLGTTPTLQLETLTGECHEVTAAALLETLDLEAKQVQLLFVSACLTARPGEKAVSLTQSLVQAGVPAALGWAGSVYDREASAFAAALYKRLSGGLSVARAVAKARLHLYEQWQRQGEHSQHWHLARVLLGPEGGGALASPRASRRSRRTMPQQFLDADRRVKVAGPDQFVGRRRLLQRVMRELRGEGCGGVLLHGFGNLGKSSLAARVSQRLSTHTTAVVFGEYTARAVLEAVARVLPGHVEVPVGSIDPAMLERALDTVVRGSGSAHAPLLLVIDDLERVLEAVPGRLHQVDAEHREVLRAVLRAFGRGTSLADLLVTSRYVFELDDEDGASLVESLRPVSLSSMGRHELHKQARALRSAGVGSQLDAEQVERTARASQGNPGLMSVLMAAGDEGRQAQAVEQMEVLGREGTAPTEAQLVAFLEDVDAERVVGMLTASERALAWASMVFEAPFPDGVVPALADVACSETEAQRRLHELGVWEGHRDLVNASRPAFLLNGVLRGVLVGRGPMPWDAEQRRAVAEEIVPELESQWAGGRVIGHAAVELVRLAVVAEDGGIAAKHGDQALLAIRSKPQKARGHLAGEVMACVEATEGVDAPAGLLFEAAQAKESLSPDDVKLARQWMAVLVERVQATDHLEGVDIAQVSLAWGRRLVNEGRPAEALEYFQRAQGLYERRRDVRSRAITVGYIANILKNKGEVDRALALHREVLGVVKELGDARESAVTLMDIASILTSKGHVEEALALHREALEVFERLGETREGAIARANIARILTSQGQTEQALSLHREQLKIYEELGDARERIITLGDIARLLATKGDMEEALAKHREQLRVCEELGDARFRAIIIGDVARILAQQGRASQALSLHLDELEAYEKLGDTRSCALALADIASILADQGDEDQVLAEYWERIESFEALGDKFLEERDLNKAKALDARALELLGRVDDAVGRAGVRDHIAMIDSGPPLLTVFVLAMVFFCAAVFGFAQLEFIPPMFSAWPVLLNLLAWKTMPTWSPRGAPAWKQAATLIAVVIVQALLMTPIVKLAWQRGGSDLFVWVGMMLPPTIVLGGMASLLASLKDDQDDQDVRDPPGLAAKIMGITVILPMVLAMLYTFVILYCELFVFIAETFISPEIRSPPRMVLLRIPEISIVCWLVVRAIIDVPLTRRSVRFGNYISQCIAFFMLTSLLLASCLYGLAALRWFG